MVVKGHGNELGDEPRGGGGVIPPLRERGEKGGENSLSCRSSKDKYHFWDMRNEPL